MVVVAERMTKMLMTEHDDRYTLAVPGGQVTQLRFDWAITLIISAPPQDQGFIARISGHLALTTPEGATTELEPEGDPAALAPLLRLARLGVTRTDCFKDGRLHLEFTDGTLLTVPSDPDYEPWEIAEPTGAKIVSTPGGELAVWGHPTARE
jgi:hypothetical protein